jgi:ATP-citrate lyase beta-subunit
MLSSPNPKYLIIAGAIANFTQIDKTFTGIIDVLEEKSEKIKKK